MWQNKFDAGCLIIKIAYRNSANITGHLSYSPGVNICMEGRVFHKITLQVIVLLLSVYLKATKFYFIKWRKISGNSLPFYVDKKDEGAIERSEKNQPKTTAVN